MKLREVLYLLGFRPKPRTYPYEVVTFDLPDEGQVSYARWRHPAESEKKIRQSTVDRLREFIRPGDVAIDVGAHTGDTTLPMAMAAGPDGAVLALEPNPFVFPVLQANARLNRDRTRIIPRMFAATPEPGRFTFEYSDPGYCNGGRHQGIGRWRHGHAFELEVRGVHLESWMERHHPELIPRLRYLKVDTEGWDYEVLVSMRGLIRERTPYIRAEVYRHLDRERRTRLFDFFADLGYGVHLMEGEEGKVGRRLARDEMDLRAHFDVFGVPEP